jgi:hypothetical protein
MHCFYIYSSRERYTIGVRGMNPQTLFSEWAQSFPWSWASRDLIPQVSWSACDPPNHSPLRTLVRGSRISVLARQWPHSFSNADWFDFSLQNGIVAERRG